MNPGLYKRVPFEDYLKIDAVSQTTLKKMQPTALHCRDWLDFPPESTPAQEFGSALHDTCLLPDRIGTDYVVAPDLDRRTNKGKAEWAAFQASARDKVILKPEQMSDVKSALKSLQSHRLASDLIHRHAVAHELVVIWEDEATGILCKARLDCLTKYDGFACICDLKTTRDASPDGFAKSISQYGYDVQAAFYLDALTAVAGPIHRPFYLIVIENFRPWAVAVYELSQEAIEVGRDTYRPLLELYAECLSSGEWPGYPNRISEISLPHWRMRQHEWEHGNSFG